MAYSTRPSEWLLVGLLPAHTGLTREEFPLLSAKVHYDLADVQMLANLSQTYTSNASVETEIRYVFPLPPDASVCAFKAVIDGDRTIKGVVKEKEKAKAEYEQAIAQGHTAAVLEQENVEIFQVSLGNIRPKQKIEVQISFVAVVTHDGTLDSLRLTFPSTIAPRYGTPPAGLFGPSYTFNNSALDISIAVEMTSHIKSISSPSHPIAMKMGESTIEPSSEFDPTKARVSLTSPTLLDKDIVMVLACQGLDKPRCMVESFSPEEGAQEYTDAYALTLVPRFDLPALPSQEYIFLVDRSGSMGGGKMDAVRSALQILLMSLPSRGTCFNIMSFGSHYSSLWQSSVTYSAESVKAASAHVDTMTANYGGTEIRSAVLGAFNSRVARAGSETTATSIFVLTDGEAYDLEGVKSSIAASVKEAKAGGLLLRIFCMGIGNTVSKAMCEVIARAGRGTTAFVGETEKPDQKLMGLLRAARGAPLEDISIDWGVGADDNDDQDFEMVSTQDKDQQNPAAAAPLSLFDESQATFSDKTDLGPQPVSVTLPPPPRLQQAPAAASLPSLYPGFRTSLFAIVKRGAGGNTAPSQNVHINGSVLGRPVMLTVPVTKATASRSSSSTKLLHALAARALIQSLEESDEMFMSQTKKAEVLRLAERYGLASSQTSFVAVDHDERGASVDRPLRSIPVTLQSKVVRGGAVTGLFGSMPPPPPPGTSIFGSYAAPAPPVFGAPRLWRGGGGGASHSSSLFGGGSSFGSAAPTMTTQQQSQQQQSFSSPGRGGLFGNAQSVPQTFGSSSPKAPPTGGLFGGAARTGSSPPGATPPSGSLFGSAPAAQPFSYDRYSSSDSASDFRTDSGTSIQFGQAFGNSVTSSFGGFSSPAGEHIRERERAPKSRPLFGGFSPAPQAEPAGPGAPLSPSIETFARLQAFDGSFAGSASLFQLLVGQTHAPALPAALAGAGVNKETVWYTLLSVAYLEIKFAGEKDVWAILVEKAMNFVQDNLQDVGAAGVQLEELKQAARKCIV